MRPTFRFMLHPPLLADGSKTLYLRVSYRRKNKYFSLGRRVLPDQWNDEAQRFRKNYPDAAAENDVLRTYEQRAADAIRDFERDGLSFTFEAFEGRVFLGRTKESASAGVVAYLLEIERLLSDSGRFGNSRFYAATADSVRAFRPRALLSDLTADWLTRYEAWMRRRGMTGGGISINMRVLRSACNRAIKSKLMPRSWYPFEGYSLSHLESGNVKRAITLEEMKRLEGLAVEAFERFCLDLFLFSFYCRGMNLADIAELTADNLRGGRIVYVRKKTGKTYSVAVSEKAAAILERNRRAGEGYLFPIYSSGVHVSDQQKFNRLHKVSRQVNLCVRDLAARAGIDTRDFVFYTARHTYATSLKKAGVSVEVISEALGHSDLRTTEAYLKSFGDDVLDAADRLLD